MKRFLFLIGLLMICQLAFSQEWRSLFQESQDLQVSGDYTNALQKASESFDDYVEKSGEINANYAAILRNLVTLHFMLENFSEAIEYGEKEVQVRNSIGETTNEIYATTLYNLGSAYQITDDFDRSIELFTESLQILSEVLPSSDYERIRVEWKLASSYYYSGDTENALAHFQAAFSALSTDEVDNDYLIALFDYANLLEGQEKYAEAGKYAEDLVRIYEANEITGEPIYAQSLRIMATALILAENPNADQTFEFSLETLNKTFSGTQSLSSILNQWAVQLRELGQEEYSVRILDGLNSETGSDAMSLNNLAALAFNEGRFEDATDLYIQALESLDESRPEDQKTYAAIAENFVMLLETVGQTEKALELQEKALELNKKNDLPDEVIGQSETNMGRVLVANNKNDEALQYYNSAITKLKPGTLERAEALNGLAALQQQVGNYSESEKVYLEALVIFEQNPGRGYAAILNNLGSYYKETGQFLQSRNYFDKALEQVMEVHGSESLAYSNTLQNLALLDLELGSYREAEKFIAESLAILEKSFGKQHRNYTVALLNYGRIMLAQGKYREAEPAFSDALDIRANEFKKSGPYYAEALNSMAYFYQTLGNFAEAEPLLRESLQAFEKSSGKNSTNYATALENLATLYQLRGDYESAKPLLEEALVIDRNLLGEDHPLYSTTLHNLASLYKESGEFEKAGKLFNEALEIDRNTYGKEHPGYARTLYNLAALKQDQEKYEEAEALFEEVAQLRLSILGEDHPEYAYSLYGLASIKRVLNKPEAEDYYRQAVGKYLYQIESYFPALSEKEKSAFYEKIKPVFESFKDFAIEQALDGNNGTLKLLYDLQLSTKALLLNSSSKIRQRILSSQDAQLVTSFQDWLNLKERLVKYYSLTLEELETEDIDLKALSDQANDLEKVISEKSELFAEEIDRQKITMESVSGQLEDGEAAVEIFRIEKSFAEDTIYYAALVVDQSSTVPELALFRHGNQLEKQMFNYYRNAIRFTVGDKISYDNFWMPLKQKLGGASLVYISSDGIFNKISYNTLWDYENDIYVIDEYDLRLVSNTREVVEQSRKPNIQGNDAIVFGDPNFGTPDSNNDEVTRASDFGFRRGAPALPGTAREIESLGTVLKEKNWSAKVYKKDNASEDNFKEINSPRLLHIATHGFFMSDLKVEEDSKAFGIHLQNEKANPLFRSGLLFSGSNQTLFGQRKPGEDGILTAYEAMNLSLEQTELVVMSACETGLGAIRNGEGVYGLQRAFLVAGARSVIMSLWKVNDETTQLLMSSFYDYWLSGKDKLEAFNQAQLDLKKQYPDPYHWGAFVILGD